MRVSWKALALTFSLLMLQPAIIPPSHGQTETGYVSVHNSFYVHTPGMFYDYVWCISVLSLDDNNHVTIYQLPEGKIVGEADLSFKQVFRYNGSETDPKYFKITSTKPVSVYLHGGQINAPASWHMGWGQGSTFYSAVDGKLVGKRFIFTPMPNNRTYISGLLDLSAPVVFAVEDSQIKLYGPYGIIDEWFMFAGTSRQLSQIPAHDVYTLESTGKVLIGTFNGDSLTVVPSTSGELLGREFITRPAIQSLPENANITMGGIIVFAYEDCQVSIFSLSERTLLKSLTLANGEYSFISDLPFYEISPQEYAPRDIYVTSTGTISVWAASARGAIMLGNLGDDVTFLAGSGTLRFYAPSYAIIFSPEKMTFELDGSSVEIEKDGYMRTTGGYHEVQTSKPLIVQVVALHHVMGQGSGPNSFCSVALSVDTATPEAPGKEGGFDFTLIGIAAAVAIVVVIVFVKKRRKRGKV